MLFLLSHIVDRAAVRFPEALAFSCDDNTLSYVELRDSAQRLAHLLLMHGLRRGDRVGILLPKCLETATAVYGVLKAGGAYVPIDPSSPLERVAALAENCGMRHLITDPTLAKRFERLFEVAKPFAAVVGIEPGTVPQAPGIPWRALDDERGETALPCLVDEDLAYIMYTSGSTGEPKGIIHTHHSGLAYATMAAELYEVKAGDRLGNFAPLHFDQSTFEMFAGPLRGATTVFIPEAAAKLPASLTALMERERLTHWYSVPYVLIQMLSMGGLENRDLRELRWVQYGGEAFPVQHLRELMRRLPHARFSNVYGPAEVNQCCYRHLNAPPPAGDVAVPIGGMCPNAEGLVVDHQGETVETGEAGELLVRSATMMRGYCNRPELNARAFYKRSSPGGREVPYYRTGDRVRVNPAGELEFLGRLDRQVKSRGFRIELDEIEAHLGSHESVAESVVFSVRDGSGTTSLEAVVLPRSGGETDARELRRHLAGKLPRYAIPSKIEIVRTLPRTGTGKVDRLRLQQAAEARDGSDD